MASTLKTLVSKKKLRYVKDGYNLDLSYISDRIIAMGFPAENLEAVYRNSLDEVKKFLDEKHENHYKIYNLCSEKIYDKKKFHGRVEHYPFDDHHPPTFALIGPFCEDVQTWLAQDPKNVAAVHCKAGKGRTGVMICCYLLHCGLKDDAAGVLNYYGSKRTADKKGVTIPSQRRYIHYYDRLLNRGLVYKSVKLYLRCIVLDPVPCFTNIVNDCFLTFVVYTPNRATPYESRCYIMKRTDRQVRLEVEPPLLVSDDVKIEFFTRPRLDYVGLHPKLWRKGNKEFHFWLNTFFVDAEMNGGLAHDILTREHTNLNSCESWSAPTTARVATEDESSKPIRNLFLNHSQSAPHDGSHREEEEEEEDEMDDDLEEKFRPKFLEAGRRLSQHAQSEVPAVVAGDAMDTSISHLMPQRHHQTVVGMSSLVGGACPASLAEIMKQHTFQDETTIQTHPQQQQQQQQQTSSHSNGGLKNGRVVHVALASSNSNASSSSSSSSSLTTANNNHAHVTVVGGNDLSVTATATSFNDKRTRHASVPQTASSPGAMSHLLLSHSGDRKTGHNSAPTAAPATATTSARPVAIDGTNIALRLNKSQIDKAAKDKQCKIYSENFNVTLFLVKPTDQSDDLVDYSLVHTNISASSENFHHITVTPVMSSASTTSCNVAPDEDFVKWKGGNAAKGSKVFNSKNPSAHKSRMALMHFPKKSSSEEEVAFESLGSDAHRDEDVCQPPVSPRAVTFADSLNMNGGDREEIDIDENFVILPTTDDVIPAEHKCNGDDNDDDESKNPSEESEESAANKKINSKVSQSTWI